MSTSNKFVKNIMLHIKYPYTALIISIMWIGMAIMIASQKGANFEVLIAATAFCTLIIAAIGFRSPK